MMDAVSDMIDSKCRELGVNLDERSKSLMALTLTQSVSIPSV